MKKKKNQTSYSFYRCLLQILTKTQTPSGKSKRERINKSFWFAEYKIILTECRLRKILKI